MRMTARGRVCVGVLLAAVVAGALATHWLLGAAERDLEGVRPPPAGAYSGEGGSIGAQGLTPTDRLTPDEGLFAFARRTRAGQALQAARGQAEHPGPADLPSEQPLGAERAPEPGPAVGPTSGPSRGAEPATSAADEPDVYVAGVVGIGGAIRVLLVRRSTGESRWVGEGGYAFGYTVVTATLKGATLSRGGRTWELRLGAGAPSRPRASGPGAPEGPTGSGASASSSGPDIEQKLIGTWSGSDDDGGLSVQFAAGGSGAMWEPQDPSERVQIRWRVEGSTLHLTEAATGDTEDAQFSLEGDRVLVLTMQGETVRLTKQ